MAVLSNSDGGIVNPLYTLPPVPQEPDPNLLQRLFGSRPAPSDSSGFAPVPFGTPEQPYAAPVSPTLSLPPAPPTAGIVGQRPEETAETTSEALPSFADSVGKLEGSHAPATGSTIGGMGSEPLLSPNSMFPNNGAGVGTAPVMTDTQKQTSTQATVFDEPSMKMLNDASTKQIAAANNMAEIIKQTSGTKKDPNTGLYVPDPDSEYTKQLAKIAASSVSVEDALDPSSPGMQAFQARLAETREKLDKAQEDVKKYQESFRLDPNRYVNDMPIATRATNSLFIYLEQMAAAKALGKGATLPPTTPLEDQLNRAIALDIESQKKEYEAKREAKTGEVNRYRENLNMLKNDRSAELKTKVDFMTANIARLQQMKDAAGPQVDAAKMDMTIANLQQNLAKTQLELNKSVVSTSIGSQLMGGTGQKQFNNEQFKAAEEIRKGHEEKTKPYRESMDKLDAMEELIKLAKQGNGAAANTLLGQFAKHAQGDSGVLTDNDLKTFSPDKGFWAGIRTGWAAKVNGTLSDTAMKNLEGVNKSSKELYKRQIAESVYDTVKRADNSRLDPDLRRNAYPSGKDIDIYNEMYAKQEAGKQK